MLKVAALIFGLFLVTLNSQAQPSNNIGHAVVDLKYQSDDIILENATLTNLKDGGALYIGEEVHKFDGKTNTWSKIKSLNIPRSGHKSLLLDDGRVFVVGGSKKVGDSLRPDFEYVHQPEIFNPATGSWSVLNATKQKYYWGTLVQLANKIMVFGNSGNRNGSDCDVTGVFDLSTNTWTEKNGIYMYCYVAAMQAYKLRSGKLMILNEVNGFNAEIYDPVADKIQSVPAISGNNGLTGIRADGSVFVAVNGGGASWHQADEMKLLVFDEHQNKWTTVTTLNRGREGRNYRMSGAFGLADGRYVFYGYRQASGGYDGDVYNPSTNTWTTFGDGTASGNSWPQDLQMTLLPNSNKILMMISGAWSADLFTF